MEEMWKRVIIMIDHGRVFFFFKLFNIYWKANQYDNVRTLSVQTIKRKLFLI